MRLLLLTLLLVSWTTTTRAQSLDLAAHPLQDLTALRLQGGSARHTGGLWLLGAGLLSTLGGAAVALVGRDDRAYLSGGLTTASFGLINGLLSLGLLDLSKQRERGIRADCAQPERYLELREREIAAELQSGQFYALNTGLDVAYIATGVALYVFGAASDRSDPWEKGVGVAFFSQGLFLLVFDIASWVGANQRAARLRALALPPGGRRDVVAEQ